MPKKPKIVATIEARMTSSRLPGKVLMEASGTPMLAHLVNRLKRAASLDDIVLATTVNSTDDVLVDFARKTGIPFYRGSEDDVMLRVIGAGESVGADILVEITGDCPVIDPGIVEQCVQMFLANQPVDYVSNVIIRSYPIGMDTQVFRLETLKKSAAMTGNPLDHEHVSLHMINHPESFSRVHLLPPPELYWPELGLTLDERDDYLLLKKIIEHFGPAEPYFSCLDAVSLLRQHPEWVAINTDVKRKGTS